MKKGWGAESAWHSKNKFCLFDWSLILSRYNYNCAIVWSYYLKLSYYLPCPDALIRFCLPTYSSRRWSLLFKGTHTPMSTHFIFCVFGNVLVLLVPRIFACFVMSRMLLIPSAWLRPRVWYASRRLNTNLSGKEKSYRLERTILICHSSSSSWNRLDFVFLIFVSPRQLKTSNECQVKNGVSSASRHTRRTESYTWRKRGKEEGQSWMYQSTDVVVLRSFLPAAVWQD